MCGVPTCDEQGHGAEWRVFGRSMRAHPSRRTRPQLPPPLRPPPPPPPDTPPRASTSPRWSSRWSLRLTLAAALALLAPGLAIGALHVNDILSADLLPGTLFLREGPHGGHGPSVGRGSHANTTSLPGAVDQGQDGAAEGGKPRAGNWTDAFLTMNFHR